MRDEEFVYCCGSNWGRSLPVVARGEKSTGDWHTTSKPVQIRTAELIPTSPWWWDRTFVCKRVHIKRGLLVYPWLTQHFQTRGIGKDYIERRQHNITLRPTRGKDIGKRIRSTESTWKIYITKHEGGDDDFNLSIRILEAEHGFCFCSFHFFEDFTSCFEVEWPHSDQGESTFLHMAFSQLRCPCHRIWWWNVPFPDYHSHILCQRQTSYWTRLHFNRMRCNCSIHALKRTRSIFPEWDRWAWSGE